MSGRKHMTHMTALDKNLLTTLFEEKKDILNLKTKDTSTNDRKKVAWVEIATKFNSSYCISATRTPDQLSKAWENMLAKARRESLGVMRKANRKHITKGGGTHSGGGGGGGGGGTYSTHRAVALDAAVPAYHHQAEEVVIALDPRGHMDMTSESQEEPRQMNGLSAGAGTRKRPETRAGPPTSQSAEIMIMRHAQHEAEMEKLHWETLYWRTKYEREFGQNVNNHISYMVNNSCARKSESTDQGSSDNCSNF